MKAMSTILRPTTWLTCGGWAGLAGLLAWVCYPSLLCWTGALVGFLALRWWYLRWVSDRYPVTVTARHLAQVHRLPTDWVAAQVVGLELAFWQWWRWWPATLRWAPPARSLWRAPLREVQELLWEAWWGERGRYAGRALPQHPPFALPGATHLIINRSTFAYLSTAQVVDDHTYRFEDYLRGRQLELDHELCEQVRELLGEVVCNRLRTVTFVDAFVWRAQELPLVNPLTYHLT